MKWTSNFFNQFWCLIKSQQKKFQKHFFRFYKDFHIDLDNLLMKISHIGKIFRIWKIYTVSPKHKINFSKQIYQKLQIFNQTYLIKNLKRYKLYTIIKKLKWFWNFIYLRKLKNIPHVSQALQKSWYAQI